MNQVPKDDAAHKPWHSFAERNLLNDFDANKDKGLSEHQIKSLQSKYGPNLVANGKNHLA